MQNALFCAGENHFGQIGLARGTFQQVGLQTAMRIFAPLKFRRVVAGVNHTCAIGEDRVSMACFGDNRSNEVLPIAAPTPFQPETGCTCTSQPVWQPSAVNITLLTAAAASGSTCVRRSSGETACWGTLSTLGFPATQPADRITAGGAHLCALVGQAAFCAGNGGFGQLGHGRMSYAATPVAVSTPPATYSDIAAGGSHTCGITTSGDAFCWGENLSGQLGIGATSFAVTRPTQVTR